MRSFFLLFLVIVSSTYGSQLFFESASSLQLSSYQDIRENENQIVLNEKNDAFTEEIKYYSDEFKVNINNGTTKISLAAYKTNNLIVVAWGEYIDNNLVILGQLLNFDGKPISSELYFSEDISINITSKLEISISDIDNNYFAVSWSALLDSSSSGYDIFCRIFFQNGTATTDTFVINDANDDQSNPLMASYDGNKFMVLWTDINGIYQKSFYYNETDFLEIVDTKLFTVLDPKFVVINKASNTQYLISWEESDKVNVQYVFYNGTMVGNPIFLLDDNNLNSFDFSLFISDTEEIMFTWSNTSDIFMRRFSLVDEDYIGDTQKVNTYNGVQKDTKILGLSQDAWFIIVWISEEQDSSGDGIFGQFYDIDCVKYGEEFPITVITNGNQTQHTLLQIEDDTVFAIWISDDGIHNNIYGRVFEAKLELIRPYWVQVRASIFLVGFLLLLGLTFVQFFRLTCCISKNLEAKWHLTVQHFFLIIVTTIHSALCGRTYFQGPLNETNLYGTFVLSLDSISYALIFGVFSVTILVLANVFHVAVERGQVAHVKSIRGPFQAIMGLVALFIIGYHGVLSSFEDEGRKMVLTVLIWVLLLVTFCLAIVMFIYCHLLAKALRSQIEPDLQPGKKGQQVVKKKKVKGTVLIFGPIFSTLLFLGVIARRFGVDDPHNYETYNNIFVVLDFFTLFFLLLFLDRTMYQALISHSKTRPYTKCAIWCIKHDICSYCYPSTQVAITPYVPRAPEITSPSKIREYTPSKKREYTPSKKRTKSAVKIRAKSPPKKRSISPSRLIADREEETARFQQHLKHIDTISCLSLSLNGKRLYSGGNDNRLLTWDIKSGSILQVNSGHTGKINYILPFRTPKKIEMVATASDDHSVIIWDPLSRKHMKYNNLPYHRGNVTDLCYSGTILYSSSTDKTVIGYEPSGKNGFQEIILHKYIGSSSPINQVVVVPDEQFLYGACVDGRIRVWDMRNPVNKGKELIYEMKYILDSHVGPIKRMKFIKEKNEIISVDSAGSAIIWRAPLISPQRMPYYFTEHPNADIKASLGVKKVKRFLVHKDAITSLALAPGGRIAFTASRDGTSSIWDIREMERKYCVFSDDFSSEVHAHFTSNLNPIPRLNSCAGNANYLCTAGNEGRLRCFDVKTGKLLWFVDNPRSSIETLTISDTSVFSAGPDGIINRWSLKNGSLQTVYSSSTDKFQYKYWTSLMSIIGFFALFIEFFQLSGLVYYTENSFKYDIIYNPLKIFFSTSLLDFRYLQYYYSDTDNIENIFYLLSLVVCFLNVAFYLVAYKFQFTSIGWKQKIWFTIQAVISLSSSILFLPLLHNSLIGATSTTKIFISFVTLIFFLPIAFRVSRSNFDFKRIATMFYLNFRYDDPDLNKYNLTSKKFLGFNSLLFFTKTLAVICVTIISNIPFLTSILSLVFLSCAIYLYAYPQYYNSRINCLQMALFTALVFSGIFAIEMSIIGDTEVFYPPIHHVGMIITFLLGFYIMSLRMKHIDQVIEANKLHSQFGEVINMRELSKKKLGQEQSKMVFCSLCGQKFHDNWLQIHETTPIHIRNYKRSIPYENSSKKEHSRSKSKSKSRKNDMA